MTIYPNISPSWTWSRIATGTPILIIALTGGRPVSGSDVVIRRSRDFQLGRSWASQLVRRCNGRGGGGCRGLSRTVVENPPYSHARAGMTRLGLEGCQPPINGLGVA